MLYTMMHKNIGQMPVEDAQAHINRLNERDRANLWRMDFSELLYVLDETDSDIANPCPLSPGYCWVVKD